MAGPWGRSGDHLLLLYTGGTTGMPKGVMWRQEDLFGALDAANKKRLPPEQDLDAAADRVVKPGPRNLPAAPLMHGTGLFNALSNLMIGGSVVTMEGRRFDPVELLDTVEHERINSMSIVGDAFAKPILRALDAEPDRWDVSSLRVIVSSGVIWSAESKAGLLRHNDRLIMVDSLGSSEAISMASSTVTSDGSAATASFRLGPTTRVVTEDGRDVVPGSGERGLVAMRGYTPIGYYKDPEKSAATFQVIDGQRYSIPGDFATVDADGTVRLLGRGSQCINTGGEKVYPEEVEEVLKLHPTVADAAVVGVPDERFGEAITALVEPHAGSTVDEPALIAHVKQHLAGYKAPKRVLPIETVGRAANGKLDYRALTALRHRHAVNRTGPIWAPILTLSSGSAPRSRQLPRPGSVTSTTSRRRPRPGSRCRRPRGTCTAAGCTRRTGCCRIRSSDPRTWRRTAGDPTGCSRTACWRSSCRASDRPRGSSTSAPSRARWCRHHRAERRSLRQRPASLRLPSPASTRRSLRPRRRSQRRG